MAANLTITRIPDDWALLRIQGRTHTEVVSHISLDEGDTLLCGRSPDGMEWDTATIITPYWTTYELYGQRPVQHYICRKCAKRAIEKYRQQPLTKQPADAGTEAHDGRDT